MWREETIGDCRLILGDCLEVLPTLGAVDAVVMDPPYNFSTASAAGSKLNPWADLCNSSYWFAEVYRQVRRRLHGNGCLWTFLNWRSLPTIQKAAFDADWKIESLLVWDKQWIGPGGTRGLRPSYEMVALLIEGDFALKDRGLPDIIRCLWSSQKPSGHPAEKPIELLKWILRVTAGGRVLDPFLGSGTTGVAAALQGKAFVGIELDPRWFDIACRRIDDAYSRPDLFIEAEKVSVQEKLFDEEAA